MSSSTVRWVLALASVAIVGLLVVSAMARRGGRPAGQDVPLPAPGAVAVAELFTSEGCSSCPPADDVLDQLVHQQPIVGVEVLGLGEHVDYWNRLGWSDRFSSPAFSDRQQEYDARVFHTSSIYTPQLVVDGRWQEIGSDLRAIRHAIAQAAQEMKATVKVGAALPNGSSNLRVNVRVDVPAQVAVREVADVIVAITEDHLASEVRRGENRGRILKHAAVVRNLSVAGVLTPPTGTLSTSTSLMVAPAWKVPDLRVVALLQERQSRRILGAAAARLDREVN